MRSPAIVLALTLAIGLPASAAAKSSKTLGTYSLDAVWSTTIRLIRADRGYTIKDQDKANGYILFVYPGAGAVKECSASLELLRVTDDDGVQRIKAQLSIQHQPSYIELHLLDALDDKLRDEQGPPPAPAAKKKPEENKPKAPPSKPPGQPS
jgi:hypothetical protein